MDPKKRWRECRPDAGLTWGKTIDGKAMLAAIERYAGCLDGKYVLEVGPGYGRLCDEIVNSRHNPMAWVGLDISPANVAYLSKWWDYAPFRFVCADAETVTPDAIVERGKHVNRFDVLVSFVTLHHFHPTWQRALTNLSDLLMPGAVVIFDCHEGEQRYSEPDGTYIASYLRGEVSSLLASAGYQLVEIGNIKHDPAHERMLVVARKS